MGRYACVCIMKILVQNSYCSKPNPETGATLVPGFEMDWGLDLCGVPWNMTS